jgi:hypothetical protein
MERIPSVDRHIIELAPEYSLIFDVLRDYIERKIPDVKETYKYRCPFYEHKGMLCYINFERKTKTVVLSFVEGFLLKDKYQLLSKDTSQVKKLYFSNAEAIDVKKLDYYMDQAIVINQGKTKNFLKTGRRLK